MSKRSLVIVAAVVIAIGLVAGITLLAHNSTTQFKNLTKPSGSVGAQQALVFTFNQTLQPRVVDSEDGPSTNIIALEPYAQGTTTISGKQITFQPTTGLNVNTSYNVTLRAITSQNGKTLKDIATSVSPSYDASIKNPVSPDQAGDSKVEEQNPLIESLPVYKPHFSINYSLAPDRSVSYVIGINAYKGPNTSDADYQSLRNQYKAEAAAYIKNLGVDPATLAITYDPTDDGQDGLYEGGD